MIEHVVPRQSKSLSLRLYTGISDPKNLRYCELSELSLKGGVIRASAVYPLY